MQVADLVKPANGLDQGLIALINDVKDVKAVTNVTGKKCSDF